MCARKEQSLLFDLLKAFDYVKSGHKYVFFSPRMPMFLNPLEKCPEIPSNMSTMECSVLSLFGSLSA